MQGSSAASTHGDVEKCTCPVFHCVMVRNETKKGEHSDSSQLIVTYLGRAFVVNGIDTYDMLQCLSDFRMLIRV
jgi:hypothetical protein